MREINNLFFIICLFLFFPALAIEHLTSNKNVAVVQTKYGGHIGFTEGLFVKDVSFVEKLFSQYASFVIGGDPHID